ncbi:putative zinc finger protein [Sphaerotilus hippei]|uniref:Putative zinc finger protein n=1 Tax=Sphaerotilus hippei TaxID=744406 RepID=A0A318HAF6_9BURK|nr:zf-HC2 domain-containing protein [Sphaerotilus hippei]PXW99272.1 putative zinc finger protein [Sphaerotilus hippei]
MKLMRTCREAATLMLQGADRELQPIERLSLRLHLLMCRHCRRFRQQTRFMARTMDPWRSYRDQEKR